MSDLSKFPHLESILIDKIYGKTGCWIKFNNQYTAWQKIKIFAAKKEQDLIAYDNFDTAPDYADYPILGCDPEER